MPKQTARKQERNNFPESKNLPTPFCGEKEVAAMIHAHVLLWDFPAENTLVTRPDPTYRAFH